MQTITGACIPAIVLQLLMAGSWSHAAENLDAVGQFTLEDGSTVLGVYHAEAGTLEIYKPSQLVPVQAVQIIGQRLLVPEHEAEPKSKAEAEARITALRERLIRLQEEDHFLHNQEVEREKDRQQRKLEQSKREEGNKEASELMLAEMNPERKAVFAALCKEHLQAIEAAHAAIATFDQVIEASQAKRKAYSRLMDEVKIQLNALGDTSARMSSGK